MTPLDLLVKHSTVPVAFLLREQVAWSEIDLEKIISFVTMGEIEGSDGGVGKEQLEPIKQLHLRLFQWKNYCISYYYT